MLARGLYRRFRRGNCVGRADIHPAALQAQAAQAAFLGGKFEQSSERKRAFRRVVKQRGRENRRAGIDQRRCVLATRATKRPSA